MFDIAELPEDVQGLIWQFYRDGLRMRVLKRHIRLTISEMSSKLQFPLFVAYPELWRMVKC